MSLNFGKKKEESDGGAGGCAATTTTAATTTKKSLSLDEVLREKRDTEEKARWLEEQAIMLRCPDRKCRVESCDRLGTHVIAAIEDPLNNVRMEYSGRYSDTTQYIGISDNKHYRKTDYNRRVFKPLMFLCDEHVREQIELNGGEYAVAKMRDNILKGKD